MGVEVTWFLSGRIVGQVSSWHMRIRHWRRRTSRELSKAITLHGYTQVDERSSLYKKEEPLTTLGIKQMDALLPTRLVSGVNSSSPAAMPSIILRP